MIADPPRAASWPSPGRPTRAKAKVDFNDQVAAIFASRCNACHNADKAKGGLALETYAATIQGGGSGKVVEAGRPRREPPLGRRHARRRTQDAAQRAQDPRRRTGPPQALDRRRVPWRPRAAWRASRRSRSSNSSSTPRPWASPSARRRCPTTSRPSPPSSPPGPTPSSPWRPAPGPPWWRWPGTSRCSCITPRRTAWSASCPSPRARSTSSSSAGTGRSSWPAAAGGGSRAWRWSSTSGRASGRSRSARSSTRCSPPTSAPTTARWPSAGRARSSGSTAPPTASSSSR